VLSWACRRFRARFAPGSAHPHRLACGDCDAFAKAVELAVGVRLPLPAGLRLGLQAIARPEPEKTGTVLPFPVPRLPRLPLPDATAARLRSIVSAHRSAQRTAPPEWVRSPRYAVAASALLALLLGPFLAPAADRGLAAWGAVRQELSPLAQHTEEKGREELENLHTTAVAAVHDFNDLSTRLSTFVHESLMRRF
jgi:hypothetical protein